MNSPWMKAYVMGMKYRHEPEKRFMRDVWFTTKVEEAMYYESKDVAESDVRLIFEKLITIQTASGHKHRLEDFKIEERAPKQFVVSVEGPFDLTNKK